MGMGEEVSNERLEQYAALAPDDEPNADELAAMARELLAYRTNSIFKDDVMNFVETFPKWRCTPGPNTASFRQSDSGEWVQERELRLGLATLLYGPIYG